MYPLLSHVSIHNHLNNSENQTLGGARLSSGKRGLNSAKLQETPEQKFRILPRVSAALGWAEQLLPQPWGAQGVLESQGQCPSPQNKVPHPKTQKCPLSKTMSFIKKMSFIQDNVLNPKTISFIQDNVLNPKTMSLTLKQYSLSKIKSPTPKKCPSPQNNVLYPKQCPSSKIMS